MADELWNWASGSRVSVECELCYWFLVLRSLVLLLVLVCEEVELLKDGGLEHLLWRLCVDVAAILRHSGEHSLDVALDFNGALDAEELEVRRLRGLNLAHLLVRLLLPELAGLDEIDVALQCVERELTLVCWDL